MSIGDCQSDYVFTLSCDSHHWFDKEHQQEKHCTEYDIEQHTMVENGLYGLFIACFVVHSYQRSSSHRKTYSEGHSDKDSGISQSSGTEFGNAYFAYHYVIDKTYKGVPQHS